MLKRRVHESCVCAHGVRLLPLLSLLMLLYVTLEDNLVIYVLGATCTKQARHKFSIWKTQFWSYTMRKRRGPWELRMRTRGAVVASLIPTHVALRHVQRSSGHTCARGQLSDLKSCLNTNTWLIGVCYMHVVIRFDNHKICWQCAITPLSIIYPFPLSCRLWD